MREPLGEASLLGCVRVQQEQANVVHNAKVTGGRDRKTSSLATFSFEALFLTDCSILILSKLLADDAFFVETRCSGLEFRAPRFVHTRGFRARDGRC